MSRRPFRTQPKVMRLALFKIRRDGVRSNAFAGAAAIAAAVSNA